MDDKAQVSLEYMIIITLLIGLAAFVAFIATNLFMTKQSIVDRGEVFKEKALGMLDV